MAVRDGPAHEGVPGLEIENVILVDAGRDNDQRAPVHSRSGRRVLEKLDQLVAEDDVAGRHREVAANLERLLVAHRNAAAPRIGGEVGEPSHQARPLGRERALQHFGIGRHEVRRRERIDVLLRHEREPFLVLFGQRRDVRELGEIFAEQQIALLQESEVGELAPFLGREAAVADCGMRHFGHRPQFRRVGNERRHRRGPECLPSCLVLRVELGKPARVEGSGRAPFGKLHVERRVRCGRAQEAGCGLRIPVRPFLADRLPPRGKLRHRGGGRRSLLCVRHELGYRTRRGLVLTRRS